MCHYYNRNPGIELIYLNITQYASLYIYIFASFITNVLYQCIAELFLIICTLVNF